MIRELSIENFMSIRKKQVLSFEATKDNTSRELLTIEVKSTVRLNRMLILYGANASGKSNILYAYETIWRMLVLPCTHKLQAIPFHPFALDKDKNTRLSVSFSSSKCDMIIHWNITIITLFLKKWSMSQWSIVSIL